MYSNLVKYVPNRKPPMGAVLNPYPPINRELIFYPVMWEGSGNKVFDLSGNGNDGTFQGTAPSWTAGKYGSAVLLPGTNEYINCGSKRSIGNIFHFPATFIISFYLNGWGQNDFGRLAHKRSASGATHGWTIYVDGTAGDKRLTFQQYFNDQPDTDYGLWTTPVDSLVLYKHYRIAVVYDGRSITNDPVIYINGVSQVLSEVRAPVGTIRDDSNYDLWLGARQDSARYFDGILDIPSIYNRALNASELAKDYQEPFCGFRWTNIIELASYVAPVGGVMAAHYYRHLMQGAA